MERGLSGGLGHSGESSEHHKERQRDADRQIAEDTGESLPAVRQRIIRGKNKVVQHEQQETTPQISSESTAEHAEHAEQDNETERPICIEHGKTF